MTEGEHVIEVASGYLGVRETSPNRGELIDKWAARWSLRGVAWCGIFADAMFAEAGVDDSGLCHPSVAEMCRRARAIGVVWDGHSLVPTGALWALCGIHVGIINVPLWGTVYSTIEGNHGDAVSTGERDLRDALIIIPSAIAAGAVVPTTRRFYVEDPQARPKLYGPWRSADARDRKLAGIPAARRRRARIVRPHGAYGWVEGPRRVYGPWGSVDARDAALHSLEHRLGHALRAYSKES